ncbi:putative component of the rsc chromatin remodeling complex [Golovinomyces cichoracearum]|uniref:Putative component of the rsc chromatin remodeling complex n=1 Tax=Golovinomyces cichoracearum TaxID=62708 RepID=A0A420II64_9PEZI|nr:putative component of the rsc chromatin remodeling complex [Golovinomyces cichoracearum]
MYSVHSNNSRETNISPGTINPAALNPSGTLSNPTGTITPDTSPRGTKRSRSPNAYADPVASEDLGDETYFKPQKRGRPVKTKLAGAGVESPNQPVMTLSQSIPPTPQSQVATLPHNKPNATSSHASPLRTTPTKNAVILKALPTVRDHTTDQLGAAGDEYLPREYDEAGEKKVNENGQLNGGREYKCRTFLVPERGDKLFMLATECARVLGYRDSYLLFNKNRSLYKIIASQTEKEDLIHQEILPFSYRSRQIAIVTAKSMFRQFGSRVIRNGRRVRDDYWEGKARKQGFTEEDLAGEKRPGAAKARDAAAAAEASANASLACSVRQDIFYSNNPGDFAVNSVSHSMQPGIVGVQDGPSTLPMISLAPEQSDLRLRDYSNIQRPRQEISGPAYQDRTQPSSPSDILSHAQNTAEYNKQINQQRFRGSEFLHSHWRQAHESPTSNISPRPLPIKEALPPTQIQYSTQDEHNIQHSLAPQQSQQTSNTSQSYAQAPSHSQNPSAPSPLRNVDSNLVQQSQSGRASGMLMSGNNIPGTTPYAYNPQGQMWSSQVQPNSQHFPHFNASTPQIQRSPNQVIPASRNLGNNSQISQALQYTNIQSLGQGFPSPNHSQFPSDRGTQQYMNSHLSGPQAGGQTWAAHQSSAPNSNWNWSGPQ